MVKHVFRFTNPSSAFPDILHTVNCSILSFSLEYSFFTNPGIL